MAVRIASADTQFLPPDTGGDERERAPLLRRPFFFTPAADAPQRAGAVLLVHGFTGTPFEMRPLGEDLARRGHTVYGPRLVGHCETSAALRVTRSSDWLRSVEEALDELRAHTGGARVYLGGLSLGGLLVLEVAARRGPEQIAGLAAISVPLWLTRAAEAAIAMTRRLGRAPELVLPKMSGSDIAEPRMRARNDLAQGNIGLPVRAVISLRDFADEVRGHLRDVRVPALVAHGRQDHVAPYGCMAALAAELGSPSVESVTLERSFHVATIDHDRVQLWEAIARHAAAHTAPPAPPRPA